MKDQLTDLLKGSLLDREGLPADKIRIELADGKSLEFASGTGFIVSDLDLETSAFTLLQFVTEAHDGGKLASLSGPLLEDSPKPKSNKPLP